MPKPRYILPDCLGAGCTVAPKHLRQPGGPQASTKKRMMAKKMRAGRHHEGVAAQPPPNGPGAAAVGAHFDPFRCNANAGVKAGQHQGVIAVPEFF